MNKRQSQKNINKAINNLIKHANRQPWAYRKQQLYDDMYDEASHHLNISTDTLMKTLEQSAYIHIASAYLFELFATYQWDNEDNSLIGSYIQRQGWKETPYGKRYLQALDSSHIELWQIVSIKTGQFIDIRPAGTTQSPSRVYECSASEPLQYWDCVAARVIDIDKKNEFSSAILPFTLDQALATHSMLANVYHQTTSDLQNLPSGTPKWSNDKIKSMATIAVNEELPKFLFILWAKQVYLSLTQECC